MIRNEVIKRSLKIKGTSCVKLLQKEETNEREALTRWSVDRNSRKKRH